MIEVICFHFYDITVKTQSLAYNDHHKAVICSRIDYQRFAPATNYLSLMIMITVVSHVSLVKLVRIWNIIHSPYLWLYYQKI